MSVIRRYNVGITSVLRRCACRYFAGLKRFPLNLSHSGKGRRFYKADGGSTFGGTGWLSILSLGGILGFTVQKVAAELIDARVQEQGKDGQNDERGEHQIYLRTAIGEQHQIAQPF